MLNPWLLTWDFNRAVAWLRGVLDEATSGPHPDQNKTMFTIGGVRHPHLPFLCLCIGLQLDSFVPPSTWWTILNTIESPSRSCGEVYLHRIDGSSLVPIRRRGSLLCNECSKLLYDPPPKPTRVEDRTCAAEDAEFRLVFPSCRNPWQPCLVSGHRPCRFSYGKIVRSRSRHLWASHISPAFHNARRGLLVEPLLLHASRWARPCSTSPAGVIRRASLSSSHVVWRARVRRHRSDRARQKVQEIEKTIRRANTS